MPSDIRVSIATPSDRADWEQFVAGRGDEAGYHAWGWQRVFENAFGHRSVYLIARRGDMVAGVLPLVEIRSRLFGNTLTSLPFLNYGGVMADAPDARGAPLRSRRAPSRRAAVPGPAVEASQGVDAARARAEHVGVARSQGPQPDPQGREVEPGG
jgi:hypothetical protein